MPFNGPYALGSQTYPDVSQRLRDLFGGGAQGLTAYPGGGQIGFSTPLPLLYAGQPPSTLDQVFASAPRLVEGTGGGASPESITGVINGVGTPTGPTAVSGSVGNSAPLGAGTSLSGGGPAAIGGQAGQTGGFSGDSPTAFTGGMNFGSFTVGSNIPTGNQSAGLVGNAVNGLVSNFGGGPFAQGLANFGLGLGLNAIAPGLGLGAALVNTGTGTYANNSLANALNSQNMAEANFGTGPMATNQGNIGSQGDLEGGAIQTGGTNSLAGNAIGQPGFGISDVSGVGLISGNTGPRGGASPSNPGASPPGDPGDPGPGIATDPGDPGPGALGVAGDTGCFPAHVEVLMADGTSRKIVDVAVGERVLTRDWDLDKEVEAQVIGVHQHTNCDGTPAERHLRIDGLDVTAIHPMTLSCHVWRTAGRVRVGDRLVTRGGDQVVQTITTIEGPVDVYDLLIDGPESFYARSNGSPWFLVHNKADCFLGDVRVLLTTGATVAIQDVTPGMTLQGYDLETRRPVGVTAECRVARPSSYYYRLNTLGVTGKHKVYREDGTQTTVSEISPGDSLLAYDDAVKVVRKERVEGDVTVYDLRVDGPRTFFVQDGDDWVLVHNKAK